METSRHWCHVEADGPGGGLGGLRHFEGAGDLEFLVQAGEGFAFGLKIGPEFGGGGVFGRGGREEEREKDGEEQGAHNVGVSNIVAD